MTMEKKKVLVTVKTYPHPSSKSNELVCTAGITEAGEWIRMYPIPHRFLEGNQEFQVFDWIEVPVSNKASGNDKRPESHTVDSDSIRIIGHLDADKHETERYRYVSPLVQPSLERLKELHAEKGVSLGVIQPKEMYGLTLENDTPDWTDEEKTKLNQTSFFDSQSTRKPLRKVPYKIYCRFRCDDKDCTEHRLRLTSWEYQWTLLLLLDQYGGDKTLAEKELNKRWMWNFQNRLGYLFLGTVNSKEYLGGGGVFIVIGHCSFRKEVPSMGEQLSLF